MSTYHWSMAAAGAAAWWRSEPDGTGRPQGGRVRALDRRDATPVVPRGLREPDLCPACEADLAHSGAFHRQYAPFHPDPVSSFVRRPARDPLGVDARSRDCP